MQFDEFVIGHPIYLGSGFHVQRCEWANPHFAHLLAHLQQAKRRFLIALVENVPRRIVNDRTDAFVLKVSTSS